MMVLCMKMPKPKWSGHIKSYANFDHIINIWAKVQAPLIKIVYS